LSAGGRTLPARDEETLVLTLTHDAVAAIRTLTDSNDRTDQAGLRIANGETGVLMLAVAGGPADGDEVVEESGVRLFLDPDAAETLAGGTLDAIVGTDGTVTFALEGQSA
jgi:Fe-S cluster assembly iron-binding protein IscA